jgi:hypothetical protein
MIKKNLVRDNKRITYFFSISAIIIILNAQNILGATNTTVPLPPFPTNPQATTSTDITNIVIQENIKTRMEIKQYCDQKIASMIDQVKTEGANIVGRNFAEMDRRVHELATKLFIKAIIGTFATILLAQLIFYILKRRVEKKHMPRAMNFKEYPVSPTQAGIIVKPVEPELTPPIPTTSQQTTQSSPTNQSTRELPTFPELQQPILLSPKEKEKIIKEQEEIDARKRKEAEKKMNKLIDEHNKNRKQNDKLKKKLSKPEQTKKSLETKHEEIQKEIDQISKEYKLSIPQKKSE